MKYQDILFSNPEFFNNKNALLTIITDKKKIKKWEENQKKALLGKGLPKNWGEIGVVYEDQYIVILRDLVRFPSGDLGSYFRIINSANFHGGKSSVILPIFNHQILLLRQFRHSTRNWHWEVPRGFGEPNVTPEENAKKEIYEEIEGEISELLELGSYHSNTGIEGSAVELYIAKLKKMGNVNSNEGIDFFQLFSVTKVEEMICNAEITDGFTIAAFTRARLRNLLS